MKLIKYQLAVVAAIIALFLSACQLNPSTEVIVSKEDGSFDALAVQAATDPTSDNYSYPVKDSILVEYKDSFQSTDHSVNFEFQIHKGIDVEALPIVEVAPHYLSESDAKHIAEVLFGEVPIYEARPDFATIYSKSEIQEKLNRWTQYTSDLAIEDLFGYPQINAAEVVKKFVEDYTVLLETAPDTSLNAPCLWQYQESWKYSYTKEQVEAENISISRDDKICAHTSLNDIPYRYTVSTRNEDDFKYNMIFATVDYGISPWSIDEMILQERVCRGKKPTEEQIINAKKKAENWLSKMDLGEWEIDRCEIQTISSGSAIDYKIHIEAVPAFYGVASIRRPQLENLKSKNAYASNYYLTDAQFIFAPDGTLLNFELLSPVDIVSVVNKNPAVLKMDKLMEMAKNQFQLSDAYAYGIGGIMAESDQEIECNVDVCNLEYGLTRVKVPNTEDSYYYIPSIALYGDVEYKIHETGETCFFKENVALLLLNAVDGSIISLDNG